jgi:hypothetical protein
VTFPVLRIISIFSSSCAHARALYFRILSGITALFILILGIFGPGISTSYLDGNAHYPSALSLGGLLPELSLFLALWFTYCVLDATIGVSGHPILPRCMMSSNES